MIFYNKSSKLFRFYKVLYEGGTQDVQNIINMLQRFIKELFKLSQKFKNFCTHIV